MAAPVQRGKGVVQGVPGAFDVLVYVTQQTLDGMQQWDLQTGKDVNGADQWWLARNEHMETDVKVEFVATTNELAATPVSTSSGVLSALGQPLTGPLQAVTLSGFTLAALNGVYQMQSGAKFDIKNVGIAEATYKLRRYADATQNTLANTVPT
jgi:hypothetical protein